MITKLFIITTFYLCLQEGVMANNIDILRKDSDFEFTINYSRHPVSVDVNITESMTSPKGDVGHHKTAYFDRNNLVKFFDNQKHKKTVFVELCLFSETADKEEEYLNDWIKFLSERGFKRVIIVRNGTFGTSLLKDITMP